MPCPTGAQTELSHPVPPRGVRTGKGASNHEITRRYCLRHVKVTKRSPNETCWLDPCLFRDVAVAICIQLATHLLVYPSCHRALASRRTRQPSVGSLNQCHVTARCTEPRSCYYIMQSYAVLSLSRVELLPGIVSYARCYVMSQQAEARVEGHRANQAGRWAAAPRRGPTAIALRVSCLRMLESARA